MIKIEISHVDGSASDWEADDSLYAQLSELRREGLEGSQLVDTLISDDWAAPPVGVTLVGTLEDGTAVNEYLPYATRKRRR